MWFWNSGGEFYEWPAGRSASIDVIADYRDSGREPRLLPRKRNAVRAFVATRKAEAKQDTYASQDSDYVGFHR